MKITKSELKEIIREEAQKFKRKLELKKELESLQEQIEEVHASGTREIPGGGGHGYGKDFKTKSRDGGPEALVEDEFEEFSFGDEGEEPVMSRDEFEGDRMDMSHSEEDSDIDIDAILAEIMDETSHMEEGEEHNEGIAEMEEMDECGTMDEMEEMDEYGHMNESKKEDKTIISEEISRMQKLAGIKKVI
jgi:hypothetical protein